MHKLSSRDVERAPTSSLWSRLETARNLLKDGPFDRQAKCQWVRRVAKTEDIELRRHSSGTYTVHGLVRCGHWTCPSCGPQRARATAGALGVAIERHLTPPERVKVPDPAHVPAHALDAPPMVFLDGGEYTPSANDVWMLTLSPPHYADEHVVDVVDRLFKATEAFFRSSVWRRFAERWGIAKRVRVLDATHGGPNGSHPHFHVALFPTSATIPRGRLHAGYEVSGPLRKNETRAWVPVEDGWMPVPLRTANKATREKWLTDDVRTDELIDAWKKAFLSAGGRIEKPTEFRTHALTLSPSENAAAYFTKWGLADEVGSPTAKSNTHLRLLDAVRSGIDAAGDAFIAWREAVDGKQWVSQLGDVCHLFEITGDDVRAYLERLRVKRDAELARRGETPVRVEPLAVKVRPHLYAGVLAVGWPEVFARLDEIAERASSPELVQLEFEGYLWRARVEAKRERHIEQEFRAAGVPEPTGFGDELRDAYERAIGGA